MTDLLTLCTGALDSITISFDKAAQDILKIILGFIIFGVALDMKLDDFKQVLKTPKPILLGLTAQLLVFPALTFLVIYLLSLSESTALPMSVALGMLLVSACPGGNMSNFFTHLAGGNTALSVTMSAISTILAVVTTPFNFSFWSAQLPDAAMLADKSISLSFMEMVGTVMILLGIPLILGLLIARYLPKVAEKAKNPMKYFSIIFFLVLIVGALVVNFKIFLDYLGFFILIVFVHNAVALSSGYGLATLLREPARNRRTIAIEVGIQNSALGLVLFFDYFFTDEQPLGGMVIIIAWWGLWHIVAGLTLSLFWSKRPVKE